MKISLRAGFNKGYIKGRHKDSNVASNDVMCCWEVFYMKTIQDFDEYEAAIDCNPVQQKNLSKLMRQQERIERWEQGLSPLY